VHISGTFVDNRCTFDTYARVDTVLTRHPGDSPMPIKQRLNDSTVRKLTPPTRGTTIAWDGEVKGFGCRVSHGGAKSFVVDYRRRADGVQRRATIGAFPDWSTAAAREQAKRIKRDVDLGADPVGEQAAERAAPTVAELCARFDAEHIAKLAPHTQQDYRSMIRNDIVSALGKMKVAAVEFEHTERLHTAVTKRAPVRANRVWQVGSKMFALAIKWRLRSGNPWKGIRRNREHLRRRYVKPDELARLTKALAEDRNQQAADVFRLLLLTGAREGEALSATWDQFDVTPGSWTKPHTATKQRREHVVPLSAPARQLLDRLRTQRNGSPWVFPGRDGRKPREDLNYAWARICKAAGIANLRIHDLRHSYASFLVSAGFSLPTVGALLGHASPVTTARYSHLLDDPLRQATERVGALITGTPTAPVIPIKKGGVW
jgi:integrase